MNELLQLKGTFEQKSSNSKFGSPKLPPEQKVEIGHLSKLKQDMLIVDSFWKKEKILDGALVSVFYNDVIAKSNRIKSFLSKSNKPASSTIVGAKFSDDGMKHIITHYVDKGMITETIKKIEKTIELINNEFQGVITSDDLIVIGNKDFPFDKKFGKYKISKSAFLNTIVDAFYIERVSVAESDDEINEDSIVTIYKTNIQTKELMEKLGINIFNNKILDETTLLLNPDEFTLLKTKAPYLISMSTQDISELSKEDFGIIESNGKIQISTPTIEPTVGVIDTLFDERVYFSEWVKYTKMISDEIPLETKDYEHGTAVSSIIVDGPTINPELDDGCGRFKVRHFGVATHNKFSSFSIMKMIDEIVKKNRDIKVWNLSLGSKFEINKNFISPEAAILDRIQYENDVIFVIAGTNNWDDIKKEKLIGAPADSLNSIVVNSVDSNNNPATYTRKGTVLSFFNKPDISYYGGDKSRMMRVCEPLGEARVTGTSFAAPWVTRKVAYLIEVLGLSREIAKALIVDSATGWKPLESSSVASLIGFGVVPKKIEDVVKTQKDEIKFVLSGISEKYDTYTYNIPVPVNSEKHPFIAKATMCYFPNCSRNQGVDYTNTELDIYLGRINGKKIKSIDKNTQALDGEQHIYEKTARQLYRKWDNTKHIREVFSGSNKAKKAYPNALWGISVKTKERLGRRDGEGISFGVVITLKEINGINRIEDFVQQCSLRGWLVNRIDVQNQIDIYNKAQEEIHFE